MMTVTTNAAEKQNINHLSSEEKMQLAKAIYANTSYFEQMFHASQIEINCQPFADQLQQAISRLLLEKKLIPTAIPLERLHECLADEMRAYNFNDGINQISTHFYETDASFMQIYYDFIRFLQTALVHEPFLFQATPPIRIHCPNAENSHHYPRYHTDIGYGHPPEEINVWLPLTPLLDGHSFRLMSVAESKKLLGRFDYDFNAFIEHAIHNHVFSRECDLLSQPVTTAFGRLLAFDSRSVHTGEPLKTHTRISIDIRIVPVKQFALRAVDYQGSGRRKILFQPGHCYHEKNSQQLSGEE